MDTIDMKVLATLQDRGRESWAALGATLGMTGPAAAERVRRLEERGVITRFAAIVDPETVGLALTAFVAVTLDRPAHRAGFLRRIAAMPEVQECHHVAGDDDYLLKVRCAGPLDLDRVLSDELKSITGVGRTRTTIVLRTAKETTNVRLQKGAAADGKGA